MPFRDGAMYVAAFTSKSGAVPSMIAGCQGIVDVFKRGDPSSWAEFVRELPKTLPRVFAAMSTSRTLNLR